MIYPKGFWARLDYVIILLMLIGFSFNYLGTSLNHFAVIQNNGEMPVISNEMIVDDVGPIKHKLVEYDARVPWLVDRFEIKFSIVKLPDSYASNAINWWGRWANYPIEGGLNVVSIGDIFKWFGSALFLLFLIPLIIRIPFQFVKRSP